MKFFTHISGRTRAYSLFVIPVVLFFPGVMHAATIEFETSATTVGQGSEILVSVLVSADELINAIDVGIAIPEGFEYASLSDGSSIVSFWVERPTYSPGARVVSFSGIVPGGFVGERGKLLELRVRTPRATTGAFSLTERSAVFLHGPDGVRAAISAAPLVIQVVRDVLATSPAEADTTPPEPFAPAISTDPALFNGQPFVTFATQDKGSGIARYEIQERSIDLAVEGAWRAVESPALLEDVQRNSYVFVRAIDRAGNIRVAIIPPLREGTFLTVVLTLLFTALLIPLAISLYNRVHRYARPKSSAS